MKWTDNSFRAQAKKHLSVTFSRKARYLPFFNSRYLPFSKYTKFSSHGKAPLGTKRHPYKAMPSFFSQSNPKAKYLSPMPTPTDKQPRTRSPRYHVPP